jgi:hypothetical protein
LFDFLEITEMKSKIEEMSIIGRSAKGIHTLSVRIAIVCLVLTLALVSNSYGLVIGNWESSDSNDNWGSGEEGSPVLVPDSTTGVTKGNGSLSVTTNGGYWCLQWNAPTVPSTLVGAQIQFDLTMVASEWAGWTKVADKIAINSNGASGWKEWNNLATAIDRDTGLPTSLDWGPWAGDANKTYSLDISDYDLTGATWFQIKIAVQGGDGAGHFYFDNALITKTHPTPPRLHVSGNTIKDPSGNVVILRGLSTVELGCVEKNEGGATNMIDRITNQDDANGSSPGWYPKVIRFLVSPTDSTVNGPIAFNPSNLNDSNNARISNLLRTVVDYCGEKNIYAVIALEYKVATSTRVASAKTFWQYMAPQFANDSHVLFDLFDEPTDSSWTTIRPNMQTLVNTVRAYAPHNLILVSGAIYGQGIGGAATSPIVDVNTVYASHFFSSSWLDGYDWITSNLSTCAAVHPVMVTEWGFTHKTGGWTNRGSITNFGQPLMDYLEAHGIGNIAYNTSYNWEPFMFDYNDSNKVWTLRVDENDMGGFVKDTLYARRNDDQPRVPYGGSAWAIPGTIQAENYDAGSPGVAYYDASTGNSGGAYRLDDVDIEECNVGGYDVNNIEAGEWLEYTVDVEETGVYTVEANVASESSGGSFHVEFDGTDVTGQVSFDATGDAGTYTNVDVNDIIPAGRHTVRLAMDSDGWSINWIKFTKIGGGTGEVLREYWSGITGTDVNKLTLYKSKYPNKPTSSELLTKLHGPMDYNDNYATRIRGHLHPLADGDYTFWIASDANSELWLSTDVDPANAIKIAYIADGNTDPCDWDKYVSHQSSDPITLVGGEKYYIEVLHKAGVGHDNVAVAWEGPGISQEVIDGMYLSPYIPITKCTVAAGKTAGLDSIKCSGGFHATAGMCDSADSVIVKIYSAADEYLVYEQTIDMSSFTKSRNTYSYKHSVRSGQAGQITSLRLDVGKKTFYFQTKNMDLTGLGSPLYLRFDLGGYTGMGVADENVINGAKKIIPTRLMRTYEDTLIVSKASARNKTTALSDSLLVKGDIAVDGVVTDSNLYNLPVQITWGDVNDINVQTFTIPAHIFIAAKKGNVYKCSKINVNPSANPDVNDGIVSASIDLDKCTFTISISGANLKTWSGRAKFGIKFTGYDETADVRL